MSKEVQLIVESIYSSNYPSEEVEKLIDELNDGSKGILLNRLSE